ncbi:hypothetical protein PMA3_20045 [Pseudomonas silesiensis]|uniref:Uncharacterized protein n=1 Tax=Pseudomonas silesiensis TaxID=1853130 RepID=A0A191YX14_9PSED|nr:hypothetical protein PMA3_20045 [Pseudomonas silesiensis]
MLPNHANGADQQYQSKIGQGLSTRRRFSVHRLLRRDPGAAMPMNLGEQEGFARLFRHVP